MKMSTRFYCGDVPVGERTPIGLFCFECMRRLDRFEVKCPECSRRMVDEPFRQIAAAFELGTGELPAEQKSGVATASRFVWFIDPNDLENTIRENGPLTDDREAVYGLGWFFDMLRKICPVQETNIGGEECQVCYRYHQALKGVKVCRFCLEKMRDLSASIAGR